MRRCIQLARLGAGHVAPNPMVGAVLVYEDRIIGEGWHQQYGKAHAEVNCIASVAEPDRSLIPESTIYVSLEPCAHFGKTPPCADLLIRERIRKVVVGCRDPFKQVDGKGIEKLLAAGIDVELGVLENECRELNARFFTFHQQHRPYVILKWAQSVDGIIGSGNIDRMLLSNEASNRLVHRWRSEEAAILVGTNTAELDNPSLTTRLWPGNSPIRIVVDKELRLPPHLQLFDGTHRTIVFNYRLHEERDNMLYYQVSSDTELVPQILNGLYQQKIQSVMVEGGAQLLQSFIDSNSWDEARVITNAAKKITGVDAPELSNAHLSHSLQLDEDTINFYQLIHN